MHVLHVVLEEWCNFANRYRQAQPIAMSMSEVHSSATSFSEIQWVRIVEYSLLKCKN